MNTDHPGQENYGILIEAMQEAAEELKGDCPGIRFQTKGALKDHLDYVVESDYFPLPGRYEEVSIGGGDVRLSVGDDGSIRLRLNFGRIRDHQAFYETLWRCSQERELPLTMTDRDPQDPNTELCQEFGFDK